MKSLATALGAAFLLSACSGGAPAPAIDSFTATPATIAQGASATLTWQVRGATSLFIDNSVGLVSGSSAVVSPTVTTVYTLTAAGAGGTTTAQLTVVVDGTLLVPVIDSFTAKSPNIARGQTSLLTWTVRNATAVSITPDPGPLGTQSVSAAPTVTTIYTLTAKGPGGQAVSALTVTVHDPLLHLEYADPPASTGGVRLVLNRNSTPTRLVLDAVVGTLPVSALGVALTLPLDNTRLRMSNDTPLAARGIDPGTGPALAVATIPATGPLASALVLGLARKKNYSTDGDVLLAPGTVIFTVAFDLVPNAPLGVVFDGVYPGAKFDAAVLKADGTRSVDKAGFAIGVASVAL